MDLELAQSLLSFLAPEEITSNFTLVSISETTDSLVLEFEEHCDLVPIDLEGSSYKLNGFMNKLELHTFPQKGKACYLQIKRRRWVNIATNQSHCNAYSFHQDGMKTTDEFGLFLKKK